jgi:hypothetical protein
MPRTVILLALCALGGCTAPLHLTYDFGRAYTAAFLAQPDLSRPAAANSQYWLYGVEAAEIRIRVREEATDAETDDAEVF